MSDTALLKPGQFRATCRLIEPATFADLAPHLLPFIDAGELPESDLPAALRWYANGTGTVTVRSHWDKKLKANAVNVSCSFATTDRDAYEDHMRDVHGRTTGRWASSKQTPNGVFCGQIKAGWLPPKLRDEGQPFKVTTKALADNVVTCERCGMVMENGSTYADELFVREHLELCVGRAGAA